MKVILVRTGRAFLVLMDMLWVLGMLAICLAWWIGLIYKDSTPATMWLFFIPTIAVIVSGFFWLFLTLRNKFRIVQLIVFLTILACFYKLLVVDHRWNREPTELPVDNLRILHWNTAWGVLGVESIVRSIAHDDPDIVVISEPPRLDMISDIAYHALGMENVFTDSGITVASRFPITYLGEMDISELMVSWHVRIDTDAGPLELAAIDIVSRPNLQRTVPLRKLSEWVGLRTNTYPLVMVGDFNTPHDSVAFQPLRKRLRHAYEERGRLWPYSWPVPVPLYAIDHLWVSPDITVNDYFLKTTKYSDHKRQIADLSLPPKKAEPAP